MAEQEAAPMYAIALKLPDFWPSDPEFVRIAEYYPRKDEICSRCPCSSGTIRLGGTRYHPPTTRGAL